jgi:aspartate/methionine/tyrosine aminotransferase
LSEGDLESIAEVIKKRCTPQVRVYSDEVYEKILFDGSVHKSIASVLGMQDKTIIASGFSKSFSMTGWRLGFAVLPTEPEADCFTNLNINIISCTPPFSQEAGREAYLNPKSDKAVANMVKNFEERRDYAVPALNAIDGITCANPKGAFYVFPNISGVCEKIGIIGAYQNLPVEIQSITSPSKLFQMFLLYQHGVAAVDRQSFGTIGSENFHFVRLSTATSLENIKEGIQRISQAAADGDGFMRFIANGEHFF